MKILVTGGAGFIGSNLIDQLLIEGHEIVNVDNFDTFYARSIKEQNIEKHFDYSTYQFQELDITNHSVLDLFFSGHKFDQIVHLAAKAGVRPSISNPVAYEVANIQGTINILENARKYGITKVVFASSSSVYGINENIPWDESDLKLLPISPYAASKVSAENYGKVYSELYGIHFIALRFFTVFGPRQRPDLAIHKFFKLTYEGHAIPFFGDGSTSRDYTYIDDIVQGIIGAINYPLSNNRFEVFNLGNSHPISLKELVNAIRETTKQDIVLDKQPLQEGDVNRTFSNISKAEIAFGYKPKTSLKDGLRLFNDWYKNANKISA